MATKVCHAHCPDESGAVLAAVLAVILTAVLAVIAAQVIESLFAVIAITGGVLIAAGTGLFIWLVHRDRIRPPARQQALTGRVVKALPSPAAQAISAPRPRAIEAPARPIGQPADYCPASQQRRRRPAQPRTEGRTAR